MFSTLGSGTVISGPLALELRTKKEWVGRRAAKENSLSSELGQKDSGSVRI